MKHIEPYNLFLKESITNLPTISSLVKYIKDFKNDEFYVKLDRISHDIWSFIHNKKNIRISDYTQTKIQEFVEKELNEFNKFYSVIRRDSSDVLYIFGNLTGHIKSEIVIREIDDEYYFVYVIINQSNRINFKCDQLDGVISLLFDLKKAFELFSVVTKESIDYSDFFKKVDGFVKISEIETDSFEEYEKEKIRDCLIGWASSHDGEVRMSLTIESPEINDTKKSFSVDIIKKKDEWFNVRFIKSNTKLNKNKLYAPLTEHETPIYFNCDQIDGVIACLEYIKKEYIYLPI
jgi:hypothetical protein